MRTAVFAVLCLAANGLSGCGDPAVEAYGPKAAGGLLLKLNRALEADADYTGESAGKMFCDVIPVAVDRDAEDGVRHVYADTSCLKLTPRKSGDLAVGTGIDGEVRFAIRGTGARAQVVDVGYPSLLDADREELKELFPAKALRQIDEGPDDRAAGQDCRQLAAARERYGLPEAETVGAGANRENYADC